MIQKHYSTIKFKLMPNPSPGLHFLSELTMEARKSSINEETIKKTDGFHRKIEKEVCDWRGPEDDDQRGDRCG